VLIVAGAMTLSRAGLAALQGIYASHRGATEAEPGCVRFSLGIAADDVGATDAGLVTVLEIWRDEAALRDHYVQPHTAFFLRAIGPHIVALDVHRYDSDQPRPLPAFDLPTVDPTEGD
jgi:quinol monooxygenase YgiN